MSNDLPGSLHDYSTEYGFGRIRAGGTAGIGIGTTHADSTSAGDNLLVTDSTEVALIDQLVFSGMTNDAATSHRISLRIGQLADSNYQDLTFHLAGTANAQRFERLVWNTRGALVVPVSGFLSFVSPTFTNQTRAFVSGRYRMMKASKAAELGYFSGGTFPSVASTNSVAGSGTSAGTAKAIVPALAGHYVEIMGFTYTGHNYDAGLDNSRLGFWDGTTGSDFDTGGVTIFRGYNQGVSGIYQSRVMVGNTRGCIQGPVGYGVYIQQTTNVAGATPDADFNVIYRYRKTTDCANNTGASITTAGKRWWRYAQGIATPIDTAAIFSGVPACGVKVLGQAGTLAGTASSNSTPVATMTLASTNGWGEEFPIEGDGAAAAACSSWSIDDDVMVCASAQTPGLTLGNANNTVTGRSHLCWGTMESLKNHQLNITTQSGKNIRNAWNT